MFLVFATDNGLESLLLDLVVVEFIFPSGAQSALPMGVAPEAMVDTLWSSICSKLCIFWMHSFSLQENFHYMNL
jgi:hypothetical protein